MKHLLLALALVLSACSSQAGGIMPPTTSAAASDFSAAAERGNTVGVSINVHNGQKKIPLPYFERSNCGNNPWPLAPFSASVPGGATKAVTEVPGILCFTQANQFAAIRTESSLLEPLTWCEVKATFNGTRMVFTIDWAGSPTVCTITDVTAQSATLNYVP